MGLAISALLLTPAAAPAAEAEACWSTTSPPQVFGWTAPPSIACRNGTTVTGAPVAGTARTPAAAPPAPPAPRAPAPETTVTFGGSVDIGFAVAF